MKLSFSTMSHRLRMDKLWLVRHLDGWLLLGIGLLLMMGLVVLYSASGQSPAVMQRQGLHILFSVTLMVLVAQISPHQLKQWAPWFYCLGLLLLSLVLVMGETSKGAQRWLDFGVFRFQPSEIMKIATPMMLAWYLDKKDIPITLPSIIVCLILAALPGSLIILQPDLGTTLLILFSGALVIFFAGISFKLILSFMGLALISLPILWMNMHTYQKTRVLTFLNPENDPLGSGYHIIQSKIALGSGGLLGKGWMQGTQTQLDFLPEQNTDFIFSVLGEEFGFVGIFILFMLYLFIVTRGLKIGLNSQDTFCRLLAGSLISIFFIYLCVNVGMVSGVLPVVGIPLPLISYGGTSMVTLMISFGILMSIQSHRSFLPR